jgi:hypothetical protein
LSYCCWNWALFLQNTDLGEKGWRSYCWQWLPSFSCSSCYSWTIISLRKNPNVSVTSVPWRRFNLLTTVCTIILPHKSTWTKGYSQRWFVSATLMAKIFDEFTMGLQFSSSWKADKDCCRNNSYLNLQLHNMVTYSNSCVSTNVLELLELERVLEHLHYWIEEAHMFLILERPLNWR